MFKRFLASSAVQTLLGRVLGWYMLLVGATTRWEFIDRGHAEALWAQGGPAIACFWHRHVIASPLGWNIAPFRRLKQPALVMISKSKEGGVAAEATRTVGAAVMRGSSSKGALEVTRQALRHLAQDGCVIITPDGPRGPRMRVEMGCVHLAKQKGAPLIGYAWSIRGSAVARSWDRQIIPPPFSRGVYLWTKPIRVPREANAEQLEAARVEFEREMIRISQEADRHVGMEIVEAADPAAPPKQKAAAPPSLKEAS